MILDTFPSAEEFYKTYWGQKPFVVHGAIDQAVFEGVIDGDSLAGLALEEDIKSRIVMTAPEGGKWTCEHGPFEEDRFGTLGEENWSLLVQNVEQYHTDTAKLLQSFYFAPRWLMDDIMVSYSTAGGSVGPHTDSYHVFLVQGMGWRKWTIGESPVQNEDYIEGLDLKVLKGSVQGAEIEVGIGDVIYIPPYFAHEGITTQEAMTFSVGFLGPKLSELMVEYGHYLEQMHQGNKHYGGTGLDVESAGFAIAPGARDSIQNDLINALRSNDFSIWLAEYFSMPSHDDIENIDTRYEPLSDQDLLERLQDRQNLYRPEHIKISMTTSSDETINLAAYGAALPTSPAHNKLVHWLNQNNTLSMQDIEALGGQDALMTLITYLYNQNILFFENEALDL
ncbi:MAG: hypothetical protein DHS20C02_16960 [Micavibrio sp.]|nr:MAG: hypothetical protein DHS20C02_16960 [Micavibrio sp.]